MKHTLAIALCAAALCGCSTVQDIIDGLPDVPAVTNALPDIPPIVVPPIVQPPASECGCDHSLPLCPDDIRVVYDRVNGAGSHAGAGNREVCWTAQSGQGYDFRCMFRSTNPRQRHVSSWGRKWGYDVVSRGVLDAKCFTATLAGWVYQFHFLGWSIEEDQDIQNTGRRITCKGRTFGFWEVRVIGPAVAPPPVEPVEPPKPQGDIEVPPRTGSPSYEGKGVQNTFLVIEGYGKNPKKAVSMSCWVRFNGWPVPKEGANLVNKGLVGSSWAYSLTVRPDALQYGATNGRIEAAFKFKAGVWYHVRIDVTATTAKFWVDGRGIPVTKNDVKQILGANEEPLRIGGQRVPDTWNGAAWYNSALDGVMSDWKVVVE